MEGEDSRFSVSMEILGKRLEVMRRKNEMSLMQNEILSLESELRQLEMQSEQLHDEERTKETDRQRRLLPDIPPGRREHVTIREPPELHLYDDSSISGANVGQSSGRMQGGPLDFHPGPITSTPSAPVTKSSEPLFVPTPKSYDKSGVKIKPATYDGTVNWTDFKAHFDACAELNGWTDKEKGLHLAVSLRGQAQGVFGNLSSKSNDYTELSNALQERFAPPNQTELYRVQLKERKQKATESLSELGQDVWRLTNLAYPTAPADLRETLAKEQFIDALVSSDMRLRIKQARPTSLNMAVRHAVELEAFNKAERKHLEGQGFMRSTNQQEQKDTDRQDELKVLKNTMFKMQKTLESLTGRRNTNDKNQSAQAFKQSNKQNDTSQDQQRTRYKRKCWTCGSEEHFRRDCPQTEKKDSSAKNDHQTKQVASFGSGLFLNCKVNGIPVESLIDTGATLTIISMRLWDTIKQCSSPRLEPFNSQVSTASGESVEIKGKTSVFIDIGGMQYTCQVVVADIDLELIMGLDFLKTNECQIDVVHNILSIHGKSFDLLCNGKLGCYRISVFEKVNVPAMSEMIIQGKVEDGQRLKNGLCIIEPKERPFENDEMLIARGLVYSGTKTPVRVMNITDDDKILYPGTNIATISPVTSVETTKQTLRPNNEQVPEHLRELFNKTVVGMESKQKKEVVRLLTKYSDIFSKSDSDIGRSGIIKHRIPTGNAQPIRERPRRVPVYLNEEVDKQIDNMLKENVIKPSKSPWSSSIVMVKKKDGSSRFCVDYRKLNDITIKDAYPLPRVDESLDQLSGSKWFSCLDLNSGYWQVEMDPKDAEKTAFTSRRGLFEFTTMPFGLCNAPATFERLMETVLAGLHWQICLIYLDDVIVVGKDFEDMIKNLSLVFDRLQEASLKLKPRKCKLFATEVEFLGHIISDAGVSTDPNKTKCIEMWPTPMNVRDVRAFLGLCGYYRRFVYKFSEIAKPLHKLTEKNCPFVWTEECSVAFEELKRKLVESPVLIHPDFTKGFILDVDASDLSIGAVLSQITEDGECVVAYASRTLSKSERRYCVTRKEMLALVYFVKYFRHYLYGKQFTVRTDHGSLRWLMKFKNPEGQVARWLEFLSSFDMKIEHRPGRSHKNADGVSRIPCRQCGKNDIDQDDEKEGHLFVNQIGPETEENANLNLEDAQSENRDIRLIKEWVEKGEKPNSDTIAKESWFVKSMLNQWQLLKIHNGLLVRCWKILGTDNVVWQAVVPLCLRRKVLKYSHDIKASGHLGIKKTVSKIRQAYYWPGLQNDVRSYIGGCEKCAKRKNPIPTRVAPMQVVRSGYPMERIAMDILGELPVTENGNKYILVISDYFTKWTESFAMPNMEARTCAKILVQEVVSRFGVPTKIHSDQGRQFESNLFAEMCDLLQIEKTRTTAYHPQSDGMVERFNRTLCAMLSAFVEDNHRNWDTLLPYVMMAYRCTEHETTGMTPNMLMLGRETNTPLDICFEMPPAIKSEHTNEWVWELRENLEMAHTFVRQNTGFSIQRQKRYHDRKSTFENLKVNDKVYVLFPVKGAGQTIKFCSFWRGPFKVIEKLCDVLYVVDCGRNGTHQVIHIDRLKKAKPQTLANEVEDNNVPDTIPDVSGMQSESASSHDEEEEGDNIEHDDYSRFGRKRRKPVWLQDFVSSLFSKNMPNLKTTPRKQRDICPVCKLTIEGESFGEHMDRCVKERHQCTICGILCSKSQHLKQHMRRKHSAQVDREDKLKIYSKNLKEHVPKAEAHSNSTDKQKGLKQQLSQPPKDKPTPAPSVHKRSWTLSDDLSVSSSSEDGSEWNDDPEIELNEEYTQKENCDPGKEDKRQVQDLKVGRVVRKRFDPSPVMAPVKRKKAEETVTSGMLEREHKVAEAEKCEHISEAATGQESKTGCILPKVDKVTDNTVDKCEDRGNLKLKFSVSGSTGDKLTQWFLLRQNDEDLIDSKVLRAAGTGMGDMEVNLGDFTRSSIKPENIKVSVVKGEFSLNIDY